MKTHWIADEEEKGTTIMSDEGARLIADSEALVSRCVARLPEGLARLEELANAHDGRGLEAIVRESQELRHEIQELDARFCALLDGSTSAGSGGET